MKGRGIASMAAAVVMAGTAGCASVGRPDDPWVGRDKAWHFLGSTVVSAGVTILGQEQDLGDPAAAGIGFGVAVSLGGVKETCDLKIKRTYWSWRDFLWDVAGAALGAVSAAAAR